MKRVFLRVIERGPSAGDILVQDNGDAGHSVINADGNYPHLNEGIPAEYDGRVDSPTRLLPFHSMTNREEAELLLGRAVTQENGAGNHLAELEEDVRKLGGGAMVPGHIDHPQFLKLERLITQAQNRLTNLQAKTDRAFDRAMKEAEKERASNQRVGRIPDNFGEHKK